MGMRIGTIISDGDSKAFCALQEDKPYGDKFIPKKKECILHAAKRVGTGFRNAKKVSLNVNRQKPVKRLNSKSKQSPVKKQET